MSQKRRLEEVTGHGVDEDGDVVDRFGNVTGSAVRCEREPEQMQEELFASEGAAEGFEEVAQESEEEAAEESNDQPSDTETPFAGLDGFCVIKRGFVKDESGDFVGRVIGRDVKKLAGLIVDEDGDVLDKNGSVVGHAERYSESQKESNHHEMDRSNVRGGPLYSLGQKRAGEA